MSQKFELAARDAVFHFNKKHLEDPTIPMWVIKARGESYYVDHVDCEIPWSTKETPDNSHTKGSIKVKNVHLVIDENNHAHLRELTPEVKRRLENPETVIRVISRWGDALHKALENLEHGPVKTIGGACSTTFYIVEFNNEDEYMLFKLAFDKPDLRELKPNEDYYKLYERFKNQEEEFIDEDMIDDDDDDEDDNRQVLTVQGR